MLLSSLAHKSRKSETFRTVLPTPFCSNWLRMGLFNKYVLGYFAHFRVVFWQAHNHPPDVDLTETHDWIGQYSGLLSVSHFFCFDSCFIQA